ncbi:MAG: 4Fe-4S binding protein [Vicinamibacterales bacterium]
MAYERGQPADARPAAPTAQTADPWGFDEGPAETWVDVLRPQALDLVLLTAFLSLAFASFFRKSVKLRYIALVAAVGYLGFVKSFLLSVVNIFGLIQWDLPTFKYSLAWYLLSTTTVVSTVLWGRFYCGRVCAFGALTQLMDAILPRAWRIDVPIWIEDRALWLKYALLAGVVVYFLATHDLLVYRYVEPFWMFGLFGTVLMWSLLAALLLASMFVRNLYCRFLCPLGAFLGILSTVSVFRIKRWSECGTCKICEKACEYGAIRGPTILVSECVRCDDCERLYDDEQKCPHWLIIERKAAKASKA